MVLIRLQTLTLRTQSATDDNGLDDVVVENGENAAGDDSVFQGGSITMEFVITNHANVSDTIDLTVTNGATGFPTGTTFQLVGADGATPIVGPLGPLAAGAFAKVNIIAKLPANAPVTAAGATNYEVDLTAQSTNGGSANRTKGRYIGAVLGTSVDLQNLNGTGDGPDALGSPVQITTATNPGVPVSFPAGYREWWSNGGHLRLVTAKPAAARLDVCLYSSRWHASHEHRRHSGRWFTKHHRHDYASGERSSRGHPVPGCDSFSDLRSGRHADKPSHSQ